MRIAVVGDVHLHWDERDVRALDAAGYDLVLVVGDLAGYGTKGGLVTARAISKLRTPALVLPGNHDAVTVPQLASEVVRVPEGVRGALAVGMTRRAQRLAHALSPVALCGYSLHPFDAHGVSVLAARPHSTGGPRLAFRRYLAVRYGVGDMQASSARLCALLDAVPEAHAIVVLAHCGPSGLGADKHAIYGCDFRAQAGDWGDPDLAALLEHATTRSRPVRAVVAGHMHHAVRGGGQRTWHVVRDGVHHINAARVPRTRRSGARAERHHVRVTLTANALDVEPIWLPL